MALVIVLIVNCVQAFSKHFYLEVLSGTMLQRPWLVFRFLNKLSAACALGKLLHNGEKSIFVLFSWDENTPWSYWL